jgi:hypothetical protein
VGVSNELNVVLTAINNVDPAKIGLVLAPNPNQGTFNLRFRVTGREDLNISILNVSGQQVYRRTYDRFSGEFNQAISLKDVQPGVYMLRINHGNDYYVRRILID